MIKIKCKCSVCRDEIEEDNENVMMLNLAKYVLCEKCYNRVCWLFDNWLDSGKTFLKGE
jgi:hypothetical protein